MIKEKDPMSTHRLSEAEKNIEKIQGSIQALQISEAVQTEKISSIENTLGLINSNMTQMQSTMVQIQSTMSQMQVTLAVNTKSLEDHMRRTENLEKRVEPLEKIYWKIVGGSTVAAIIGGFIFAIIEKIFFK